MKLDTFKFQVTGASPLMMHNAASMPERDPNAMKAAKKSIPTEAEQLKASLYLNDAGQLYFPSAGFRSAILSAAKGRKIGKVGAAGVLAGAVFPVGDEVALLNAKTGKPLTEKDSVADKRSAVNWNCRPPARIIAVRPKLLAWSCVLELEIDTELVNVKVVEEVLKIAGKVIGVGPFRPEKRGTFGRFDAKLK